MFIVCGHAMTWAGSGRDLGLSEVAATCIWRNIRLARLFSLMSRYTVLTRAKLLETAVHGCRSLFSVWSLSCRCRVKFNFLRSISLALSLSLTLGARLKETPSSKDPGLILFTENMELQDLLQILRKLTAFSFAVPCSYFKERPWKRGCVSFC